LKLSSPSDMDLLIVFSSESRSASEPELVTRFFENGLEIFHLRKPGAAAAQLNKYLKAIPDQFHNRIVIHSHFQLGSEFGLKGIHTNADSGVSASFHSTSEIENCPYPFSHIFLSPVFDSISKPGYTSRFDLAKLAVFLNNRKTKNNSAPKIIALGGISASNILEIKKYGFDGAAVLGSIWESKDPLGSFLEIQGFCRKRRRTLHSF